MIITPAVIAQLPLANIDAVVFYKRDQITTDLICCDVDMAGKIWTFHEEMKGWVNLIAHLSHCRSSGQIGMKPSFIHHFVQAKLSRFIGSDQPNAGLPLRCTVPLQLKFT